MRKTSLYLPERLKAALGARAVQTGRSEAELVRRALDAALASPALEERPVREQPVPGQLVGVGVGPGEPDLLTTRAAAALRRADRCLAPTTAVDAVGRAEAVVRQAVPGVVVHRVPFEMAPARAARDRSVQTAAEEVARFLDAGEEVAWITLGDPLVYSTFAAVAGAVRRRRPATVVAQVPGIMAFQALAARTGTVIADERTRLTVRTALDGEDLLSDMTDDDSTIVFYKGGRRLPELAAAAAASGRARGAVAGELLGMPGEQITSLETLASHGPASYLATVIVPARARPRQASGATR